MQKVTLIPRGQAKGLTWFVPGEDPTLLTKQQIFARIVGALGGRAAEEVVFGDAEVTTGAMGDLQQVTGMAKQMVINYGFSDIGPWSLMDPSAQSGYVFCVTVLCVVTLCCSAPLRHVHYGTPATHRDMIMRMMSRNSVSESLQQRIDVAVQKIASEAYEVALDQIASNREAMDAIVEVLVEKETISGDEFRAMLSEYVTIPEANVVKPQEPAMAS